ncbi:unnamed protein product [Leuciscus chuanchicus]
MYTRFANSSFPVGLGYFLDYQQLPRGDNSIIDDCTRKTRIIDIVYNASNNELLRTKTLVNLKNGIVLVDSTTYRQCYKAHYAIPLGCKKVFHTFPIMDPLRQSQSSPLNKKNKKQIGKQLTRNKTKKLHFMFPSCLFDISCIAFRPGQCGRADGIILERKELEFYLRKTKAKKDE